MTSRLKKILSGQSSALYKKKRVPVETNLLAASLEHAVQQSRLQRLGPKMLGHWNAHIYSQNFEDSIIAEIIDRLGEGSRTFVEIGVESGLECNTRLLLEQGWRGLWLEGSEKHVAAAKTRFASWIAEGRLQVIQAFVTPENVQNHISKAGLSEKLDFLSVDIDMNTHHVWQAISTKPRFACIEYNGNVPPTVPFAVAYDPTRFFNGSADYGAGLKTLETIGREKSMSLVGCDSHGINAFFVEDTIIGDKFAAPFTAEHHFEPMRLQLVQRQGHALPQ
jgi:hypothetical protein